MVAEANYGGRVTEDKDRLLIKTILKRFFCLEALNDTYVYSKNRVYYCPKEGKKEHYLEYIRSLPMNDEPEVFGLHANAQITSNIKVSNSLCEELLGLLPRNASQSGQTTESLIKEKCEGMLEQIPKAFDLESVIKRHPLDYS